MIGSLNFQYSHGVVVSVVGFMTDRASSRLGKGIFCSKQIEPKYFFTLHFNPKNALPVRKVSPCTPMHHPNHVIHPPAWPALHPVPTTRTFLI